MSDTAIPAGIEGEKRRAPAGRYWQARLASAVPLGSATYRVASRALFDDHVGPPLLAEVQVALLLK